MNRYLVTGGAGFIGSNFIRYMFKKYGPAIKIINLDALTYAGNLENLRDIADYPNYEFIRADVCDRGAVEKIFEANEINRVIHFAAESHVDRSILDPEVFVKTNVLGTAVLLNAAKKHWEGSGFGNVKYVQVSTDEVYGPLGETGYMTEDTPLDPRSPYSASKTAADLLVKAYYETYKFPAVITRCSNNYGPYQFPEKFIPLIIANALSGKKIPVYGDGRQVRDWLYVDDHAKAIDLAAEGGAPGQIYNVGGHNERYNIDIVRTIIKKLRERLPENDPRREKINDELIEHVTDRKGHDRRYAIDPKKIKADLGWVPEIMFEDGIADTIDWYLKNEDWIRSVTSGDYLDYYEKNYGGRDL